MNTPAVQPAPRKRRSRPPARLVRRGTGRPPRPGRLPALRSRRRARRGAGRRRRHGRRARPGGAEHEVSDIRARARHTSTDSASRGYRPWSTAKAAAPGSARSPIRTATTSSIQLTPDYWAQRRGFSARSEERGAALRDATCAVRLPAQDLGRARGFYADKLGLEPAESREGGLSYECGGTSFVLYQSQGRASGDHTQMGFYVADIEAAVAKLRERGVEFMDVGAGLRTAHGIADIEATTPRRARSASGAVPRQRGQPARRRAARDAGVEPGGRRLIACRGGAMRCEWIAAIASGPRPRQRPPGRRPRAHRPGDVGLRGRGPRVMLEDRRQQGDQSVTLRR